MAAGPFLRQCHVLFLSCCHGPWYNNGKFQHWQHQTCTAGFLNLTRRGPEAHGRRHARWRHPCNVLGRLVDRLDKAWP